MRFEEFREQLTSFVAESQVAYRSLGVLSSGALCNLQGARDLDKFGWGAFRQTQLQLDVLMRRGLHGTQTPCDALAKHHPIFYVGVRSLGPSGQFDHGIGLMRQSESEGVDSDPANHKIEMSASACKNAGGPEMQNNRANNENR